MATEVRERVYRRPWLADYQTRALFGPERYAVIEASTKSGKTVAALAWLLEQALLFGRPGRHYWWVAPIHAQSAIAYRRMKRGLPAHECTANETEQTIALPSGATICFKSGEHPDGLYGEDVYAAVIDEASRVREESWHAVRSTLTATRGPVRIIGNVKGRRNWAYRLARRAESGDPEMTHARVTAHDAVAAGIIAPDEVADAERVLPASVFRELYLAEPSDDQGNPFGQDAIRRRIGSLSVEPPVAIGVDLAKSVDWTVCIGLDAQHRVCLLERFQRPWQDTIRVLRELIGSTPTLVDSTGVGDPVLEALQQGRSTVQGFKFTQPSKQQLMEGLAVAIQQGTVSYPDGVIVAELEQFEYAYNRTGVHYQAPEGAHDDAVCALALAVKQASRPLWDWGGSMNPIERITALFKAAFTMRHPPAGGRAGWGPLASVPFLTTTSGWGADAVSVEPSQSAIVTATLLWLGRAFPEAPLRVQRRDRQGRLSPIPAHPLTALVATPNPYYSGVLLWQATIADWILSGNGYWGKVRAAGGRVTELWWLPARTVEPVTSDAASGPFVDHYAYRPGGSSQEIAIAPEDVVHFRYGMDPRDPRRGLSPLGALLREIYVDEEAQRFTAAILGNLGVPGVVISPENELSPEGAQQVKERFRETFGGSRRGDVLVTRGKTAVSVLSFSPQQMNLRDLRRLPEERVSAVLGIPAIVVGLGAGLDRSTFSNFEEARQAAYESNVIPTQRLLGAEIQTQLLGDFGDTAQLAVDFDLGQVRVLQPDQDALWKRLDVGVQGGWVMVNEARAQVGLEPLPDGDVVYLSVAKSPTDPAELLPPEPAPMAPPAPLRALPPPEQAMFSGGERKAADPQRYAAGIARIRARRTPPLERQISRLLERQRADITRALNAQEKALGWQDVFDVVRATQALSRALQRAYLAVLGDVVPLAEATLGVDAAPDAPTVKDYLERAGANIGGINEVTRLAIVEALQESVRLGEGVPQTAARISELAVFAPSRARTVSRTEIGTASQYASVASFRASGVVSGVRVLDGTDFDDACRAANGQLWTFDQAAAHPLQHPNCLVGGTMVLAPNLNASFARWFDGEVIVLRTAEDDLLTCTANHPVLTPDGWRAAGALHEGDHVLRCRDGERVARLLDPDHDDVPTPIEQVANTCGPARGGTTATVPTAAEAFHGDGAGSDIHVVRTYGPGENGWDAALEQARRQPAVVVAGARGETLTGGGDLEAVLLGLAGAAHGGVRGCAVGAASLRTEPGVAQRLGVAARSAGAELLQTTPHARWLDTELCRDLVGGEALIDVKHAQRFDIGEWVSVPSRSHHESASMEVPEDRRRSDADAARDLLRSLAGLVAPVQLVEVERRQFSGHVYNLETAQQWYIAERIITHNCTRAFAPEVGAAEAVA